MKKIALVFYYLIASKLPNSFFPLGKFLNGLRIWAVGKILPLGKNCKIQPNVYIGSGNNIKIGENCQINENVRIIDTEIGNYVMIAPNVQLLGGITHEYSDVSVPMMLQKEKYKGKIIIEDDVWLGVNSVIIAGVKIGKGSIIAAGSIITKDVEPYSIMGGVPAKKIKSRI
ncbi:MAG: hypothetical protein JEY94_00515 [Melioribacteraceae bacterium]|nr:hypothetical protein [Melioribacteraceae bacterium]